MNNLIKLRTTLEGFYDKHKKIAGYVLKAVLLFICLYVLSRHIGFNTILSNIWVIILISVAFAFVPTAFVMAVVLAYTIAQIFTISYGVGIVVSIIIIIMYLTFFRIASQYGFLIMLIPLLYLIKLPLIPTLMLAVISPGIAVIAVLYGTVFYYIIHYLDLNAVNFASSAGVREFDKGEELLRGVFTNSEFICMLVIMFVVYMLVHAIKRLNFNRSYETAVAVGTGVYIILAIVAELIFGEMTSSKLLVYSVGGLVSGAIAYFLTSVLKALDYTRTETAEFEDDEYNYYVKAVPKATFRTETVKVKRINKRK